jgi:hypothetical protein
VDSGRILGSFAGDCGCVFAENGNGERIGKDAARLEDLMSGAMSSRGSGGATWFSRFHGESLTEVCKEPGSQWVEIIRGK